ncbi:hypothetical protein JAAARDRAFT_342022 [Jaapia argillacea MUCL 33604]|uniref:Uncharacterized protein n=1 Tax=Jaapia argillacea MUCL 33604 TaxID=933084 RepID=A0A067PV31_9AGAM|nr:hypothetical protein JAAARDRAFT_342022 [Jaapia argillacea MUCL 33604]
MKWPSLLRPVGVLLLVLVPTLALPIDATVICLPTTWVDILIFFGTNYIAHAATIPSIPAAPWYDTASWTFIILLVPFGGLGKSIGLIIRHLFSEGGDLQKAAARGAMAVVTRSKDWEPSFDNPEEVYVKLPRFGESKESSSSARPSAEIRLCQSVTVTRAINHHRMRIHGKVDLPHGYELALPNFDFLSEYFPFRSHNNDSITLTRSQSYVKMAVSIAQLVYSTITIYRTRGNQLDRYGYAAFGLSVFPYAFMSLANFICIGVVGEYTHLNLLRTDIMREAERRGGSFDGAIGRIEGGGGEGTLVDASAHRTGILAGAKDKLEKSGRAEQWKAFTRTELSMEEGGPSGRILVLKVGENTRKFEYRPPSKTDPDENAPPSNHYILHVSQYSNQNRVPPGGYVIPHPSMFNLLMILLATIIFPLALVLPYVLIFALSGFHERESTLAERVWMMTWLSSGQLALVFFGGVALGFPSLAPSNITRVRVGIIFITAVTIFAIPAVGGFVMVGKMLVEFGTCSLAP